MFQIKLEKLILMTRELKMLKGIQTLNWMMISLECLLIISMLGSMISSECMKSKKLSIKRLSDLEKDQNFSREFEHLQKEYYYMVHQEMEKPILQKL